jgi:hypothetical protein
VVGQRYGVGRHCAQETRREWQQVILAYAPYTLLFHQEVLPNIPTKMSISQNRKSKQGEFFSFDDLSLASFRSKEL